jgi:hypothetical protein
MEIARCSTTDKCTKKMWYLYTMEFFLTIEKNEMLSSTGKWMKLENIILSEVSQAHKALKASCSFSYVE